ncbi:BRCA2-interacting transcriptional repressor EMSY-like [Antedon mediterranea]|uniref:BRCA2-interacting transcriptional repressor EMSY-like n=1 Tax=Antedon mediterranea TaxID=105859 RepID=UPI003AF607B1
MMTVWPLLLDMDRDYCKKVLRRLELEAYAGVVSAFRAQGTLTKEKRKLLTEVATVLSISTERHRAEVRRAVNDEKLATVAERLSGSNNSVEWSIEGRRLVPLLPRLVPQTAFTEVANVIADNTFTKNYDLSELAENLYLQKAVQSSSTKSSMFGSSQSSVIIPKSVSLPSGLTLPVKGSEDADSIENCLKRKCSNSWSSQSRAIIEKTKAGINLTSNTKPIMVGPNNTQIYSASTAVCEGLVEITGTKSMALPVSPQPQIGKQKVIIVSSTSSHLKSAMLERTQNLNTSRYSSSSYLKSQFSTSYLRNRMAATVVSPSMEQSSMTTSPEQLDKNVPVNTVSASSKPLTTNSASSALFKWPKVHGKAKGVSQSLLPATLQSKLLPGQKPTTTTKQDAGIKEITKSIGLGKVDTKAINLGSSSTSVVMVTCFPSTVMSSKPVTAMCGSTGQVLISSVGGARIVTTSPQFSKSASQLSNFITVTPKSNTHVGSSKSSSVMITKSYSSTTSSITKPNVIVVQKGQPSKGLHRTIPVTSNVQFLGSDGSLSSITRPRISMVSSSSVTAPNIITSSIRFPSPQYSKGSSQVIHKGSMLELMGALKGNKDSKIKTQVIIKPSITFQDGKEFLTTQDRILPSDVERLLTVRRTTAVSPSKLTNKYTEADNNDNDSSVQLQTADLVSGNQPNTECIEYDTSTTVDRSASSAIKALLEFRAKPVKPLADDASRNQHTIDLSKMAKIAIDTKVASTNDLDPAHLKLQFVSQGKSTKTIAITPQQFSNIESKQASSIIKDIDLTEMNSETAQKQQSHVVTHQQIQVTPTQMSFVDQFEEFLEKEGLSGIVDDTLQDTVSSGKDLLQTAAELILLKEDLLPDKNDSETQSTSKKLESTVSVTMTEEEFDPYKFDSREDSPVDTYIGKISSKAHVLKPTQATPVMVETSGIDLSHMQMKDFASQRLEESLDQDDIMTDSTISATGQSQEEEFSFHSSSSDVSGVADSPGNVRSSKRKRKAPTPIDEEASASHLPCWTRAALNLLQRVSRFRGTNRSKGDPNAASWFTRPVSAIEAPNYHQIITSPMDFGTIRRKLELQVYDNLGSFHSDMLQVKSNCSLYNPPEHQVRIDCEQVFQFYTDEYTKVVDKLQKNLSPNSPKPLCLDSEESIHAKVLKF